MKPIILLSVMAIAVTGLGVGFLGNDITLSVQEIGVGDTLLGSPIEAANIDFNLKKITGNQGFFKNVIVDCIVQPEEDIVADSHVFCKLTDKNGNVAAEGVTWISSGVSAFDVFTIEIDDPNFINSQVQNIHDIILVVQGPEGINVPQNGLE